MGNYDKSMVLMTYPQDTLLASRRMSIEYVH